MQKILQAEEITNTQALRKGKRKRTETMDSENVNSDVDKGQVGVLVLGCGFLTLLCPDAITPLLIY